jgi:hypothetical protein
LIIFDGHRRKVQETIPDNLQVFFFRIRRKFSAWVE